MRIFAIFFSAALTVIVATTAQAFCGFYVARADTSLFNKASQVVLVRDDDRTVITMANDYQGEPSEFAMVIPTPSVLQRSQINVADPAVIDHIDAFTALHRSFFDQTKKPDALARLDASLLEFRRAHRKGDAVAQGKH